MSLGFNQHTQTDSIMFDSDVEAGTAVDYSGTPTNVAVYGVTAEQCVSGKLGLVVTAGPCQIQAANASVAKGSEIQIDANGRAVILAAGTPVGMARENGVAAVSSKYKLVGIDLYAQKQ